MPFTATLQGIGDTPSLLEQLQRCPGFANCHRTWNDFRKGWEFDVLKLALHEGHPGQKTSTPSATKAFLKRFAIDGLASSHLPPTEHSTFPCEFEDHFAAFVRHCAQQTGLELLLSYSHERGDYPYENVSWYFRPEDRGERITERLFIHHYDGENTCQRSAFVECRADGRVEIVPLSEEIEAPEPEPFPRWIHLSWMGPTPAEIPREDRESTPEEVREDQLRDQLIRCPGMTSCILEIEDSGLQTIFGLGFLALAESHPQRTHSIPEPAGIFLNAFKEEELGEAALHAPPIFHLPFVAFLRDRARMKGIDLTLTYESKNSPLERFQWTLFGQGESDQTWSYRYLGGNLRREEALVIHQDGRCEYKRF